jgi:hypothetical protein
MSGKRKENAKIEFLNHISNRVVICASIRRGYDWDWDSRANLNFALQYDYSALNTVFNLTTGWDKEDWDNFLSDLDFDYDSGYGVQNLFGTIWYEDGSWSDRGEYDGSEWYDHHVCPPIPEDLNRLDKVREQKLNQIL